MANIHRILLVRHGNYERNPERLTPLGIQQSEQAGVQVRERTLGSRVLLISSDAPRALQTAEIIGSAISEKAVPNKRLNIMGQEPDGLLSFAELIQGIIHDTQCDTFDGTLVLVSHQPLIELTTTEHVDNGSVIPYDESSWHNPFFNHSDRTYLLATLQRAGLET